jgi:glycerophosphoryl diester phosphodiesterase
VSSRKADVYTFAHRGGRALGGDNQIATFVEALARGATGLETDAWVTRDGAVVLDHDGVLRRRGRRTSIAQVRRDELPAHVPTLEDLYESCGTDFELAVDIKNRETVDAAVRVATEHGAADRLWVFAHQGIRFEQLGAAHAAMTCHGRQLIGPSRLTRFRAAQAAGIEAINSRWLWWRRDIVAEVQALGMKAFGYDAQQPSSIRRCLAVGLDGIFSDHVDRMTAALSARQSP